MYFLTFCWLVCSIFRLACTAELNWLGLNVMLDNLQFATFYKSRGDIREKNISKCLKYVGFMKKKLDSPKVKILLMPLNLISINNFNFQAVLANPVSWLVQWKNEIWLMLSLISVIVIRYVITLSGTYLVNLFKVQVKSTRK
jgi:hypothetical protein